MNWEQIKEEFFGPSLDLGITHSDYIISCESNLLCIFPLYILSSYSLRFFSEKEILSTDW